MSRYSIAPELDVTTTPLPGEPLPRMDLAGNPAENVIVQIMRVNGTVYSVHLQVRRVGRAWKITAFDCI